MERINCAIIGSGNIGMNLLYKIRRSKALKCNLLVGRDSNSENLKWARDKGYFVSADSVKALIDNEKRYEIVFDATTAENHKIVAPILYNLNKLVIDLTPSKVGKFCIPCLNVVECLSEVDVNMVTCGGQSTVPIAVAMKQVCPQISYFEVVATISSASAGQGTRGNIDDYIYTTEQALREFTKVQKVKAMIVLNPADPPIIMRNTLYAVAENADLNRITNVVYKMQQTIKRYVPGFNIIVPPTFLDSKVISVTVSVEGSGDFLPQYAGNLDIITCAGIEMAEAYAFDLMEKRGVPF